MIPGSCRRRGARGCVFSAIDEIIRDALQTGRNYAAARLRTEVLRLKQGHAPDVARRAGVRDIRPRNPKAVALRGEGVDRR